MHSVSEARKKSEITNIDAQISFAFSTVVYFCVSFFFVTNVNVLLKSKAIIQNFIFHNILTMVVSTLLGQDFFFYHYC